MSPEKIAQLFDRFEVIGRASPNSQLVASWLVMREMQAAEISWLDLLGPLADPEEVDRRAGTIISGPCLDAFTIPQLALLHMDRLPPFYLALFAFWRHVPLGESKPIGAPYEQLWDLHQEWRAARDADYRSAAFIEAVIRPMVIPA